MKIDNTIEVAIIGGGPAGLSAAILLAQLGVEATVFERRATTSHLPRAHLLNLRAMETFDTMGVADDVYRLSPPEDKWHRVAWYTSLAGDRSGRGREIGHIHAWGGGPDRERYAAASPKRYANVPQMRLDPLLRRHAEARCPGRIHFGHEVTDLRQDDCGVHLDVHNTATNTTETVSARYAIAADGGRTCTSLLGITLEGPTQLFDMVSMHVTADLSPWATDDQVLLYYFIDPRGKGSFRGGICAMGPDTWGTQSTEWAFHQAFPWGDPTAEDEESLRNRMRDILGIPDLQFEIHAVSHWEFEGVTAQRYREGNVFLVGNAAHRHPPTGGLGLNTAIGDVDNLTWKLAEVLHGHAGTGLLDTYESERRPVGLFNVKHSLENIGGHRRIAAALGQGPDVSVEDGWRAIDEWLAEGPAGERRSAEVAEAVASNADDYGQLNVEIGFAYDIGAVIPDGSAPTATHNSLREYTPTTRPGHHIPHAWVQRGDSRVSTLDLVSRGKYTLFVDSAHCAVWESAIRDIGYPVDIVALGAENDPREETGWTRLREVGCDGALLVRPDRHVAWRTMTLPNDPASELSSTFRVLCAIWPKFKVPKQVVITDALPKNPSGKVLKRDLRAQFATSAQPTSEEVVHGS